VSIPNDLSEMQTVIEQEQKRADALSQDLAKVTGELHALQALRTQEASSAAVDAQHWAELKASLERERERADAVTRDLAVTAEKLHAVQRQRGQDAVVSAYNSRELQELREELRRERLKSQAASAMRLKVEQPQSSKSSEQLGMASLAPSPGTSSPGSLPVRVAAVQANTNGLRGVPNVVDAATLSLQGRAVRLVGVQTDGDAGSADGLTKYLDGREVDCEPAGPTDVYRCQVDGRDLSMVVLFNGGGRATPDATSELTLAADRARSARVGIWSK
jgi:endonuclease YncB( thermonuclease family)